MEQQTPWVQVTDREGDIYFWNQDTDETTWARPHNMPNATEPQPTAATADSYTQPNATIPHQRRAPPPPTHLATPAVDKPPPSLSGVVAASSAGANFLRRAITRQQRTLDELRAQLPPPGTPTAAELVAEAQGRSDGLRSAVAKAHAQLASLVAQREAAETQLSRQRAEAVESAARRSRARASRTRAAAAAHTFDAASLASAMDGASVLPGSPHDGLSVGGLDSASILRAERSRLAEAVAELEAKLSSHSSKRYAVERMQNDRAYAEATLSELNAKASLEERELAALRQQVEDAEATRRPSESMRQMDELIDKLSITLAREASERAAGEREVERVRRALLVRRDALAPFIKVSGKTKLTELSDDCAPDIADFVIDSEAQQADMEKKVEYIEARIKSLSEKVEQLADEIVQVMNRRGRIFRHAQATLEATATAAVRKPVGTRARSPPPAHRSSPPLASGASPDVAAPPPGRAASRGSGGRGSGGARGRGGQRPTRGKRGEKKLKVAADGGGDAVEPVSPSAFFGDLKQAESEPGASKSATPPSGRRSFFRRSLRKMSMSIVGGSPAASKYEADKAE